MTIEQYLLRLHGWRLLLIAGCAAAGDSRGVQMISQWRDHRVCCSPHNHRREWRYAGQQRYVCSICERIKVA
jgi:hypothetical protein